MSTPVTAITQIAGWATHTNMSLSEIRSVFAFDHQALTSNALANFPNTFNIYTYSFNVDPFGDYIQPQGSCNFTSIHNIELVYESGTTVSSRAITRMNVVYCKCLVSLQLWKYAWKRRLQRNETLRLAILGRPPSRCGASLPGQHYVDDFQIAQRLCTE